MKKLSRSITAACAIGTFMLGTALTTPAQAEKPKFSNKSNQTIVEFALTASGGTLYAFDNDGTDFDVLVAALDTTGVIDIFTGASYTVFAPNDQAFYDLTQTTNDQEAFDAAVNLLGADGVAAVLAYHVTKGVETSRSVTRKQMIKMLDGNTIRYENDLIIANESEAGLLDLDNRLSDGVVHVIDTVLEP